MQNRHDVRRIAADGVSRLPWLAPPAGYVVLIQDVAYGNRYKIARHQQLDQHQIRRGADFPFETRVALILEAENAVQAERDLHDELAAGTALGAWFDLDQFPKAPPAQPMSPSPPRPIEAVSLRDLVENDSGADSLLQEANIVGARPAPSASPARTAPSASPARQRIERRSARRRRPRVARWAFAFGAIVFLGVLLAEYSVEVERAIRSIWDDRPQRTTSPTPANYNRGEVLFTTSRAHLWSCAAVSCRSVGMLPAGSRVLTSNVVTGQRVNGSTRWLAVRHQGETRYMHSSVLARTAPAGEPTPAPSPTAHVEGRDEVFYTKTRSRVRSCANISCGTVEILGSGTKITARRYVTGQQVNGSARWIAFMHRGDLRYIHDSVLARDWPLVEATPEPSPTVKPTRIKATAVGQGEVFYVRSRAIARHCAQTSCEILAVLPPGTKIMALRFIQGDVINNNDLWIRFSHEGRHLSIHSGKLTRTPPAAATAPTAQAPATEKPALVAGTRYYPKIRARARDCPSQSCDIVATLPQGRPIMVHGYIAGQTVNGSDRWAVFDHEGRNLYIHLSLLTKMEPLAAGDAQRSQSTPLWVSERATVYKCVNTRCQAVDELERGTQFIPSGEWFGQQINGSSQWFRFRHDDQTVYIHSSYVTEDQPIIEQLAEPAPTRKPLRDEYKSVTAGQSYTVKSGAPAKVRNCASSNCVEVGTLPAGAQVLAERVTRGQTVDGSNEWIMFIFEGWNRFVHSGDLAPSAQLPDAAPKPSPTVNPTVIQPADYRNDRYYYVRSRVKASVRNCANSRCEAIGVLLPGMQVWALGVVHGEAFDGNDIWIKFEYQNRKRYVHSRFLSPLKTQVDSRAEASPTAQSTPTAASTATDAPPPTATAIEAFAANYVVETAGDQNAHIRACPSTSCEIVAKFAPGADVVVLGRVEGDTVYETNVWFEIDFEGGSAFIHSELVAEAG